MRTIFVLVLVSIFFFKSIKSRTAALLTYWWFAIFRPHDWIWGGVMTSLKLPLIAALLLIIPAIFEKKIPRLNHPIAILMVALFFFEVLAVLLNGCSGGGYIIKTKNIIDLGILIFIVLLSAELVTSKRVLFLLIAVISSSIAFHSGKGGLVALSTGADYYGAEHLTGLFAGSNAYALGSAMLLFFMIFTFQFVNKYSSIDERGGGNKTLNEVFKYLMLLLIFGSIYNIVALQSRGAFISMILSLFLWLFLHEKRVKLLFFSVMIIVVGLSAVPLPDGYTDRIKSAFADEEDLDKSAASRPHFWMTAVDIAKSHPLGVGPGCYPVFYNSYDRSNGEFGFFRSVHSSHFQVLSDAGFIGFSLWSMLFLVAYRRLWMIRKAAKSRADDYHHHRFYFYLSNALICAMTVFLLGGSFYEYAYNEIIWLVWGMVIAVDRLFHEEENSVESRR